MPRHFPNWIEAYISYANYGEAPPEFHYWTAVATVAAVLRRKVVVDMGTFRYYPNFFIFFVAPAGIVAKSTTAAIGMEILYDLDYIHIGPSATTWQALVRRMSEIQEEVLHPDGSYEAMSAITVCASELGTFLDPRDRGMIDALVSLWDGQQGEWEKLTKEHGSEVIVNPWINIIGCTTPAWIAENLTEYFSGGGFASRTVFVYAEKKYRIVAYPFRHMPPDRGETRRKLIEDLKDISSMVGEYTIAEDAADWGEAWYEKHLAGPHKNLQNEKFSGYLARKQGHVHKLAMILAASKRSELIITKEDLIQAVDEVTRLEDDMPKVYGSAQREKSSIFAVEMLQYITSNGPVGKQDFYRRYFNVMSYTTYEEIVESMIGTGRLSLNNIAGVLKLCPVKEDN